jgi:signal peptidase I
MTVPAEPTEPPNEPHPKPRPSHRTARAVLFAALVALPVLLRLFFFEGFKSSSESMAPTLFAGEHFVLHRRAYGIGAHHAPERGDVIVFPSPDHPDQHYVNRVIGLPGDTIQIQRGIVFINGWRLPTCVAGWAALTLDDKERLGLVMVELLGDTAYLVLHEDDVHDHGEGAEPAHEDDHNAGPYTVPLNEVFVLGDRREHSRDSRNWFGGPTGGVRIDSIKGRAGRIWMSTSKSGIRGSRIGTSLAAGPKCPVTMPPEVCQAVEKCLATRPSRDVTTPPPAPPALTAPALISPALTPSAAP